MVELYHTCWWDTFIVDLSLFIQFVDKKNNTHAEYQRKISAIYSYQPSKPILVEAYY